jgi:hypothetical protein
MSIGPVRKPQLALGHPALSSSRSPQWPPIAGLPQG